MKLFLCGNEINIIQLGCTKSANYCATYKKNTFFKIFRKIPALIGFSLDNWKTEIKQYDTVVIFDTYYNSGLIKYILQHNNNARIVFYCWNSINTINKRIDFNRLRNNKRVEFWSYNYEDCLKYNMTYNPQFWNSSLIQYENKEDNIYDLAFIGFAKDRLNILNMMHKQCQKLKLNSYFYINGYPDLNYNTNKNKAFMPYVNYINDIAAKSRAILDIVTDESMGLTLRPLEALLLKKKLVTNYTNIKNYDFYCKENVFIIGIDDMAHLEDFIHSKYKEIPQNIVEKYDIKAWEDRFDEAQ